MKILFMLSEIGGGGAERLAVDLACFFQEEGHDVSLCLTRPRGKRPDALLEAKRVEESGVRLLELPRRGAWDFAAWKPFVRFLRAERPDLIHSHTHGTNFWAALWGPLFGIPTVCHEHSWSFTGNRRRLLVDRFWIGRRATKIIAVSLEDQKNIIETEKIPAEKVVFIENGVAPPPEEPRSIRKEFGATKDDTVCLSLARLAPQKRIDRLIEAAAIVLKENPSFFFLVAGGGDAAHLQKEIDRLGIGSRFLLLGRREDRWDLLASADIFCLSSDSEGTPLAALEAANMGVPIISTRVGGMAQIVEGRGVLARRSAKDLARALLEAPTERQEPGGWGIEQTGRELETLYRSL